MSKEYNWKFSTIGGVTRVNIDCGEAIAHLGELDKKLWTVLSCPIAGLEMDSKSLAILDSNGDGRIHADDVVAVSKWLCKVLKDPQILLAKSDTLALDQFNENDVEGLQLKNSAIEILKNLGLEKDSISVDDTSDSIRIFAQTKFNGDGVITEKCTEDAALQQIIKDIIATVGSSADRSGEAGINADQLEAFYSAAVDYVAWKDAAGEAEMPFGENTEAALAACDALRSKVADYFMRCKLVSFNADSTNSLDVTAERIAAIGDKDLSACGSEIAQYPIARVTAAKTLPLVEGVNPAWQGAVAAMKALVFPDATEITEDQWNEVLAKFGAFLAWKAAKKGDAVEALGYDRLKTVVTEARKADILALIAEDKAVEAEANAIDSVDKLLRMCRDFYTLICNFVSFKDFYNPAVKSIFQAGTLYIDQRSCELCIKVADMGKSAGMAPQSGMFVVYCDCVSKQKAGKMCIAAMITNGEVNDLVVGKNAIFYDRDGHDWDATIVKVVDNPISVRQAFFSPYRKMAKTVEDTINKFAADKDSKMMSEMNAKIASAPAAAADGSAAAAAKPPFDIAKFAGIFAAVGMAIGALGAALATIFAKFMELSWWQIIIVIILVMLCISGPSMLMAWLKLRKRDLSPVMNANGWAMNAKVKVNVHFGSTLTKLANLPIIAGNVDPFAGKKMACWKKWLISLAVLAILAVPVFFFIASRCCKDTCTAEPAPVENLAPAADDTPADAPAAE